MQRVTITTLGCRLNQFESDALERRLVESGFTVVADGAPADVHILNSCTITHQADNEANSLVRRLHRDNPAARIVVTGCYATAAAEAVRALPGVSLVVGNADKDSLVQHLQSAAPHAVVNSAAARQLHSVLPPAVDPRRSRVYLKIQDGCDYRCSFCIVPMVRGKSRSLPPQTLWQQVDELVAGGVPEIVLTGVHLGTYGRDLPKRTSLVQLLEGMLPRLGGTRLRLSSLDPHEVSDALIELMAAYPQHLCRYLHLPVQSADSSILRLMRRAHTVDDLTQLVPRLVQRIPGIAIGSDVIVGFPQEGEAEFDNTYRVLESLPMSYLHVFSYSKRQGTHACDLPGHVPPQEIARRSRRLRRLSAQLRERFIAPFLGTQQRVVVHRQRDARSGELVGVTDNYIRVHFEGDDALRGRAVDVQVRAVHATGAGGALVTT